MPKLLVFEGSYYSQLDEAAFYRWFSSIAGVVKLKGFSHGLEVTLRSATPSESALRDLLAIHFRYALPMADLARFKTERNAAWFCNPSAYWYLQVFGPSAVSANIDGRLAALHTSGSTRA